jgi:phosphatidylethanolamine/phosphatidyl-N-methylethanolamine N-methyltransferase
VLHPGRLDAIERMRIRPGQRVLEVGVGTGINAALYPRECSVTGIDFSDTMLEKARDRVVRKGVLNVGLFEMDAAAMTFADNTFDIVYAPYVISVVPDPVAVVREMRRVCKPGGRIIILNHFRSRSRVGAWLERVIAPFTLYLGFKSDLDLPAFLVQADLEPISIEKVNFPRIWSLVTCVKEANQ